MRARLPLLALAAGVAAWSAFAQTAVAQTVVKVGVILTYSGPEASLGETIDRGIKLWMKEHGNDLPGIKVDLIRRDDTGPNPEVAKRLAQELAVRDKVSLLTGVVWSPNAAAIAPITKEAKLPFVIMNASGSAIVRMSPYVARISFTLWQSSYPLGKWAATHGIKRAYTAVSDFIPGHDGETAFVKAFTENGGTIVDSVRFPLASPDLAPFFQRAKDAKPDALYVFVPAGPQSTNVIKTFKQLDLAGAGIKLIGPQDLTIENELPNMGDAVLGVQTMGDYAASADRPANKAFVAAWRKEYGQASDPDFLSLGGWDGMAAIFDVIKAQNGKIDPDKTMELLKGWKHDSPRGPIMIDPETRDVVQHEYMRETKKVGGRIENVEFEDFGVIKDPWKEFNPAK
ncbi:MAG TPA: ABC transporter substrate-binding protein [Candidatus Sulfotelmatobacter sp.]|nr:ABC transporter substrate-binding protein [Candidatus Sulfotelmatobacter sp.]